jgi:oxygen-independent coproporphyrinogen-3 oxidase
MIGLGMSAISDSWYAFAQNEKKVEDYQERVNQGKLPVFRGHLLSETDLIIRKHILDLMCRLETEWNDDLTKEVKDGILEQLSEIRNDGLLVVEGNKLIVKEEGRMFVRNVCMAFDLRLKENKPTTRVFSTTI